MFYLTLTVEALCMAYPAQCSASFSPLLRRAGGFGRRSFFPVVSLCLEKRKTSETIPCARQGPSTAALLSGHVLQMGMVLLVIEFKPSHPKIVILWLDL